MCMFLFREISILPSLVSFRIYPLVWSRSLNTLHFYARRHMDHSTHLSYHLGYNKVGVQGEVCMECIMGKEKSVCRFNQSICIKLILFGPGKGIWLCYSAINKTKETQRWIDPSSLWLNKVLRPKQRMRYIDFFMVSIVSWLHHWHDMLHCCLFLFKFQRVR